MGTATTPPTEDLRPILEEVREDLLDLGLRNPLLNYRLLKSRGLETAGTSATDVYLSLVTEGHELAFLSAHGIVPRKQLLLVDGEEAASVDEKAWRQLPTEQQALWGFADIPEGSLVAAHGEKELESRLSDVLYRTYVNRRTGCKHFIRRSGHVVVERSGHPRRVSSRTHPLFLLNSSGKALPKGFDSAIQVTMSHRIIA